MHNKCYSCKHRRNIPGDAHISCNQPLIQEHSQMIMLSLVMGASAGFQRSLNLSFDSYAIQSGWLMFPENFDPTWISGDCKVYENHQSENIIAKQEA